MSRTYRKIRRFGKNEHRFGPIEITTGDDSQASYWNAGWYGKRKMKPYTTQLSPNKYEVPHTSDYVRGKGFEFKEGIRNANRSMKKGVRQKWKNEVKKELENLDNL